MTLVLITGSRDWPDVGYSIIHNRIQAEPKGTIFLEGGCPEGADRMVEIACQHLGYHYLRCPALWNHGGKAAGPRRNRVMVSLKPEKAIAFRYGGLKSRGTTDCINAITAAKIDCDIVEFGPHLFV